MLAGSSEIDLSYGLFFRRYVECKNMPRIDLEHVAKFKEVRGVLVLLIVGVDERLPLLSPQVLNLNKISPSRGLFVTTGYYGPRAITIGIKTINGSELRVCAPREALRLSLPFLIVHSNLTSCLAW